MKTLAPHDPRWKDLYAAEASRLRAVFDDALVSTEHIGSTSIPDILAKPVIDIAAAAISLDVIDRLAPKMGAIGYEARGEHGIPGRRYFKKRGREKEPGFHLHVFERGSDNLRRHLLFRDFLLAEPGVAADYSALKKKIVGQDGALPPDYSARKDAFIADILRRAALRFPDRK